MIRVRFAPSPTGELHVGGARTALYNYLFAQKMGGSFIIRIEDTDRERFVPGSLDRLLQGLKWLGLAWQEGPDIGGPYGPYIQSERLAIYQQYAEKLIKHQAAYYCFCSTERLNQLRLKQQNNRQATRYDRACLNLNPLEIQKKLTAGEPHTIRLKVPTGQTTCSDLIRGQVTWQNQDIDDQVLIKSDGFPTYHLANVVDDHLMAISHVIRGEEWLPSLPKHLLLYQAFGWNPPLFAHLPNVLNQQGTKLSKRKDGAAVWVQTYQAEGYLPQALTNFLALLGWHPSDEREKFNLTELAKEFSIKRVQKSGAVFNLEKLRWFNHLYLQDLTIPELDNLLKNYYPLATSNVLTHDTLRLSQILQERLTILKDASKLSTWFFKVDSLPLTKELLIPAGETEKTTKLALYLADQAAKLTADWTKPTELINHTQQLQKNNALSNKQMLWPARVALTHLKQSPDFYTAAWALGKDQTIKRISQAQQIMLS